AIAFGDGPLSYFWSNGDTSQSIIIAPGDSASYCVMVSDTGNCISQACWDPFPPPICHVDIFPDPFGGLNAAAFGVPPFTYSWNTGETDPTIFPTTMGDYCVTVTDATGCESDMCFFYDPIMGPDSCWVDIMIGYTGAGLSLVATPAGVAPFTYEWSNGATTQSINVMQGDSSVYCVTVTDATGCAAVACTSIVPPPGCDAYISLDSIGAAGELYLTANGLGEPPYAYAWHTGETTQSIVLGPNNTFYCVTVTDNAGCEAVSCDSTGGNFCDVYVVPSAAGGLIAQPFGYPPFDYQWSTGDTTQNIQVGNFGLYCVTVTDATGCVSSSCFDFQPPFGDSCFVEIFEIYLGSNEHILEALPFGFPPFTFNWNTGETTSNIIATSPGTFCVTVVDAMGCESENCISIQSPTTYKIAGFVYNLDSLGGPPFITGKAILYGFDPAGNPSPVDTVTIGNLTNQSYYDFGDKPAGEYLVQIVPNNPNVVPTYHLAGALWDEADIITLPYAGTQTFDVLIFNFHARPGPGNIAGQVVDVPGFDGGVGPRSSGALEGVHILLFDQHTDEIIEYMATDADGRFAFNDLAYGDYRVMVDIVGKRRAWLDVSLTPANSDIDNLLVEVSESDINLGTTGLKEIVEQSSIILYPNPVLNDLNVSWNSVETGQIMIRVTDLNGKMVYNQDFIIREGENQLKLDVSTISSGLYFLNLTDGKSTVSSKFVKR
ncbi:MAG: T9SS type A sorting domain-containing protein, partial [Saprospiraceae bacterium]|nr:T9SS type A sorting domain-containing protein [Saprospiraceae bacterium]